MVFGVNECSKVDNIDLRLDTCKQKGEELRKGVIRGRKLEGSCKKENSTPTYRRV